ncbi:MAG TPA: hypothetical protein DEP48_03440 [Persephonella sp.]|uniref:DUF302 domain-containing protein n=1 Tax=Persephonella marina (strain DSM 14350 / EX-H1) TaxID=123214 RepID=C0QSK1_PERMH|nr:MULTISPECIES: hypothetical protein [Persephonella]ACO04791.1 hypothetical protein PERMA_1885 [Persephonella marina EX-H1]HCB69393.1 hypothetical protein [Persephonella sp.]
MNIKRFFSVVIGALIALQLYASAEVVKSSSGDGLVIYRVEMDADEVIQLLKANLEAQQITLVDTTNPTAPLSNNIKIFPDFDKLNISYIQNFLVTSMTTLYKIFTVDPNAMVLSPWVISIYQYEDDDYTYIVRTKSSELLKNSKHKQVIEAVKELEGRIDSAIQELL